MCSLGVLCLQSLSDEIDEVLLNVSGAASSGPDLSGLNNTVNDMMTKSDEIKNSVDAMNIQVTQ